VQTTFRPYRNLGHFGVLTELMKGMEGEYTRWLERDCESLLRSAPLLLKMLSRVATSAELTRLVRAFVREDG
jgi:hypothetical protein